MNLAICMISCQMLIRYIFENTHKLRIISDYNFGEISVGNYVKFSLPQQNYKIEMFYRIANELRLDADRLNLTPSHPFYLKFQISKTSGPTRFCCYFVPRGVGNCGDMSWYNNVKFLFSKVGKS